VNRERDTQAFDFGGRHVIWHGSLKAIGGEKDLLPSELSEFNEATERVFDLMRDGEKHSAAAIRMAAGTNGRPASEGLRRMRALRLLFVIAKERDEGSRGWRYWIARSKSQSEISSERPSDQP